MQKSCWAALWDPTDTHGCPAVSFRSDVSDHSRTTAPRSQPLCPGIFSLSVLLITHTCRPPVNGFLWSAHSRLSPVVWFCLSVFEGINRSRRIDIQQQDSCVVSCLDADAVEIPPDWTMLPRLGQPNPLMLTQVLLLKLQIIAETFL